MSNPYPTLNFPLLTDQAATWARQAGQIAMRDFNRVMTPNLKADDTLVTRTDTDIEAFLVGQIRAAYPDHNLLAEEGAHIQGGSPYTWAVDPLDGTTVFVRGLPGWGISLALLHQGQPIFGLFYMPLLDDLTYATPDVVVCNDQPLYQTVCQNWAGKGFLAVSAGAHQDFKIDIPRIRALGSVAASLVYTARGAATAALIPKAYLWDLAAGALIVQQAGGELRYLSGEVVDYTALLDERLAPEPVVVGSRSLVREIRRKISPSLNKI